MASWKSEGKTLTFPNQIFTVPAELANLYCFPYVSQYVRMIPVDLCQERVLSSAANLVQPQIVTFCVLQIRFFFFLSIWLQFVFFFPRVTHHKWDRFPLWIITGTAQKPAIWYWRGDPESKERGGMLVFTCNWVCRVSACCKVITVLCVLLAPSLHLPRVELRFNCSSLHWSA
jgi:hypothetical protein